MSLFTSQKQRFSDRNGEHYYRSLMWGVLLIMKTERGEDMTVIMLEMPQTHTS